MKENKQQLIEKAQELLRFEGVSSTQWKNLSVKIAEFVIKQTTELMDEVKQLQDVLIFCNIELCDDKSIQFKPKALKHYCGEIVAKQLEKQKIELEQLRNLKPMAKDLLAGLDDFRYSCSHSNYGNALDTAGRTIEITKKLLEIFNDPKLTQLYGGDIEDEDSILKVGEENE